MAAAWFNALADRAKARALSAGTAPGPRIYPEVIAAMTEAGVALDATEPKLLTEEVAGSADMLVTMGCGEACPVVPGVRRADWPIDDPKGAPVERVRAIRDEVRDHVKRLLTAEGWNR